VNPIHRTQWSRHLTSYQRKHPSAMRAAAPYWNRPPTVGHRADWCVAVRLLESFETEEI
jgi:hypothetical protein